MNPQHHAFTHQHPYGADAWGAGAGHHQQSLHHPAPQHQAHTYGRMPSASNAGNTAGLASNVAAAEHRAAMSSGEQVTDDDRHTLEYVAQLLNQNTRETALLELSKKREQVPELALVLWHSFGELDLSTLHLDQH